jgi:predicted enzyme related to lactoylglutathione lyase
MVVDPLGATFLAVTSAQVTATITPTLRPFDPNQSTPGALSWWQLNSTDPVRSLDFYTSVLGWAGGESDNDKFTYWRFFNGQPLAHAGLMAVDERSGLDVPDGWQVYFHDDEVADAARRLVDLSGSVVVEPTEIVSGSFLVARDPAGHVFGVDRMTHGPVGGASQ